MRKRAALLALGIAVAGCTAPATDAAFVLYDGSIEGPSHLTSDLSVFTAINSGERPHTLVVTTNDGSVVAASDLIQPGETARLAVELRPGVFQVSCRIVVENDDGELIDHYELGMRHTVNVTAQS